MEKIKPKSKVIRLKEDDGFVRLLASQFGTTADIEINLIKTLIKFDMFVPFELNKHIRLRIQRDMNIPYSTLGTAITRLIKSGIIARNGKNVYVNVAFRGLDSIDSIVFKKA